MKKILFIAPCFFQYHNLLKDEILKQGYEVDFYDDRPRLTILGKCILRLRKNWMAKKIEKYFQTIKEKFQATDYEKVLIVLGQSFEARHIRELKALKPDCEFIYYTWDAISNFPNILEMSKAVDRAYSFDKKDCEEYEHLQLMPLFYSLPAPPVEKKREALIYTTVKKGKMQAIQAIEKQLAPYVPVKKRLFLQSKLVYWYFKLFTKELKGMKIKDFVYERLPYAESCRLSNEYLFVVDVPMEHQVGLTIRTLETLNSRSKLITTNESIKDYDFYKKENVFVIGEEGLEAFLSNTEFAPMENFEKYSITEFVKRLING